MGTLAVQYMYMYRRVKLQMCAFLIKVKVPYKFRQPLAQRNMACLMDPNSSGFISCIEILVIQLLCNGHNGWSSKTLNHMIFLDAHLICCKQIPVSLH